MADQTREIVDGLLRWWHRSHGMVRGIRNANLYKLAAAFNNYGIEYNDALDVCLRFEDPSPPDPFSAREITAVVKSAYRRTEHAVKQWEPRTGSTPPRRWVAPKRVLTESQTAAIVDRLADELRKRWSRDPPPSRP